MKDNETTVRANVLALALGVSEVYLKTKILKGAVPFHDEMVKRPVPQTRVWHLSTLKRWRPDIARRCEALLKTLEDLPLTAA